MPLSLRRTIRWLRRTLIILIVLLGMLAALFMTSTVQTWAARRVTSVLHTELGLDVSLGRLQYSFPNRVVLRDVLLRDDQQDTVIGIGFMSTRIDLVNSKASRIQLGRTNFQDLWLYLHKHEGDSINGFAQFIKKFKRDEDREKKDFYMDIRSVHIERMRFHLLDETCSDCFHLLWPKAELNARKVMIYPDSISADIQHLSFNDPERFALKHMEAQAHYAARSSALNNWLMVTDSSRLSGSAQLAYDSTSAFRSFIDEVSFKLELIDSRLDLREGHRFLSAIPALPGMQIELQASGKLNELDIESLELLDGKRTQLAMSGSMRDIQDDKGPALDLQIEDLSTYVKALPRYLEPLQTTIALPSFMDSLNLLEASGQLTRSGNTYGYTGKLEAKGLGLAEPDIELQLEPNSNRGHRLSGGLRFESLNLHLLSENNSLQSASGVVRMDLRLPKGKIPEGRIKAALTDLGAMDRQFGGIQVEGAIENQSFTGALHVIDPKVEFHFFGTADLGAGVRGYDFKAHLKKLDLAELGLVDDSVGKLAARVELKAAGVFPED